MFSERNVRSGSVQYRRALHLSLLVSLGHKFMNSALGTVQNSLNILLGSDINGILTKLFITSASLYLFCARHRCRFYTIDL